MFYVYTTLLLGWLAALSVGSSSSTWSYVGTTGPAYWGDSFPTCGNGLRQSPIDIKDVDAVYDASLTTSPLSFSGYDTMPTSWDIKNNGHSVQVDLPSGYYSISGGPLASTYNALQFHLHWGSDDSVGSEHVLNSGAYPAEVHIVHQNAGGSDLAVVGIWLKISEDDNGDIQNLFDSMANVVNADSTSTVNAFNLEYMVPDIDDPEYYTYLGSLTTPSCDEIVTWIVMAEPLQVSRAQLAKLRSLKFPDNAPMVDNYRPVQALNGRIVRTNTDS